MTKRNVMFLTIIAWLVVFKHLSLMGLLFKKFIIYVLDG